MSDDVTAREAVERLARILRYDEDERQDRIEGGMMLVALLDRAERAEAERDAAFAAGQEEMRERAFAAVSGRLDESSKKLGKANVLLAILPIWLEALGADIRALPLKGETR